MLYDMGWSFHLSTCDIPNDEVNDLLSAVQSNVFSTSTQVFSASHFLPPSYCSCRSNAYRNAASPKSAAPMAAKGTTTEVPELVDCTDGVGVKLTVPLLTGVVTAPLV
jgi:hypothetical protein